MANGGGVALALPHHARGFGIALEALDERTTARRTAPGLDASMEPDARTTTHRTARGLDASMEPGARTTTRRTVRELAALTGAMTGDARVTQHGDRPPSPWRADPAAATDVAEPAVERTFPASAWALRVVAESPDSV